MREVTLVYLGVCVALFVVTRLRAVPWLAEYVHLLVGGIFLFVALHYAGKQGGLARFGVALGGLLGPTDETDRDDVRRDETRRDDSRRDGTGRNETGHDETDETRLDEASRGEGATSAEREVGRATSVEPDDGPFGIFELARVVRRGLPSALREIGVALGVAAVIFPPFSVGFYLWHGAAHPFRWNLPPDFASFVAAQLVVVALPEEVFFRGWVQTRLHDAFAPRRVLGAWLHPGVLIAQSVLFAIVHVFAEPHPARLAVFFPGLVFAWLRGWRGGVGAAIVFHAISNVFSELLVRGWLR